MKLHSLSTTYRSTLTLVLGFCATAITPFAQAQVVIPPSTPVIGSSNTVTADPLVSHPNTTPCKVTLFTNLEFADFNTKNFTYAPPEGCAGPWAKVVFKADFTMTAGRQFDRTAQFFLGGANLYFGTTVEPRATLSPSWHVESDVTDLSALLGTTQAGTALLGNFVGESGGVDYTGIIYANSELDFYPPDAKYPAPVVPEVVIGLQGNGGAATLNSTSSQLTDTVTLPTNVEKAYLDVIAQSQSNDEFWYLCVPNDLASELESCGSTGFRETEVSIDGIPAGVAPVYPWIYTGGIDPYLWEPIPGVQTLNFKPFRVDLTPFAGVLSNGKPHTVAMSVFNADSYFSATATLLAYTDKDSKQITGSIVSNTLAAAPTPTETNNIVVDSSGNVTGSVTVASKRQFSIVGTAVTSHGKVTTSVAGYLNFSNSQNFVINDTVYDQDLKQSTDGLITTTTLSNGVRTESATKIAYPFTFNYDETVKADGTITVHNASNQQLWNIVAHPWSTPGWHAKLFQDATLDEVISLDDLYYDASGNYTGHAGKTVQNYVTGNSTGYCYSRAVDSKNLALTSDTSGAVCQYLFSKY